MPDLDEDTLRQLMVHATRDLVAPRAATTTAIKRQRQHRTRVRVSAVAGAAAAAGLAAGVVVSAVGASSPLSRPRPATPSTTPIQLTAAQRALFALSAAAAKTPRPEGRYVVLSEESTTIDPNGPVLTKEVGGKTSVIDTLTGGGVQYQDLTITNADGTPVPPGVATAPAGTSPTRAQLDAMPTDPHALRTMLLQQAEQQQAQDQRALDALRKRLGKVGQKAFPVPIKSHPETADDLVFEQAANLLWEPDLSPALRSALYKVLAATPGVTVQTHVTDSSGRPATEISRRNSVAGDIAETFEDPATGQTLESAWVGPGKSFGEDLYLSIHYTSVIPPNPYKAR